MPEMRVVKTPTGLRGFGEDESAYKKFKGYVEALEPGEMFAMTYKKPRNPAFHRKFFALLKYAFDTWEPERKRKSFKGQPIKKSFDQFRHDITVLAGYYEQTFDLKGRMQLRAKSIAFDKMDDGEFAELYGAALDVLLKHVLTNYKREDVERVVAELEAFGG